MTYIDKEKKGGMDVGKTVSGTEFIVRIHRPNLSSEEYERRMEGIKQASANLLFSTERAYIKKGLPFPEYLREFVGEEAYLASQKLRQKTNPSV